MKKQGKIPAKEKEQEGNAMARGRAVLFCMAVFVLFCVLTGRETPQEAAPAAKVQGEYTVYTGLMAEEKEWVQPVKLPPQDDWLMQPGTLHIVTDMASMTDVGGMVGMFLPLDGNILLRPEAVYALCDMALDWPLHEGMRILRGYVSPEEQDAWRREAEERYARVGKTAAEAQKMVPPGGMGDHQTGLAVDIRLTGKLHMGEKDPLQRSETGQWLARNMWQYGFVYQADGCEEIHLRYVGKYHGLMMHVLGMGLDGYTAYLKTQGALTLCRHGRPIVYVKWLGEAMDAVQVPAGMPAHLSGDGRGNRVLVATAE